MRNAVLIFLLAFVACSSAPPPTAPPWETVPSFVTGALCTRLQMDAIGTAGGLLIVPKTQPIATPGAILGSMGLTNKAPDTNAVFAAVRDANRPMDIAIADSPCGFRPLTSKRLSDDTIVEISAPFVHPSPLAGVGLFARVSVGTAQEWYWVALGTDGTNWGIGSIKAMQNN